MNELLEGVATLVNAHAGDNHPTLDLVVASKDILIVALASSARWLANGGVIAGLAHAKTIRLFRAGLARIWIWNDAGRRGEHTDTLNRAALCPALSFINSGT